MVAGSGLKCQDFRGRQGFEERQPAQFLRSGLQCVLEALAFEIVANLAGRRLSHVDAGRPHQMAGSDSCSVTRHGWLPRSCGCLTPRPRLPLPPPGSSKEAGSTPPVARRSAGPTGVPEETVLLEEPCEVFGSSRSPVRVSSRARRSGAMRSRKSESARREILGSSRTSSRAASGRVIHSGRCNWVRSGCRTISIVCPRALRRPRHATRQPDSGWKR